MQDQRIEKIAAVALNIIKVLLIVYLAFEEVLKIGTSLRKIIVTDNSQKWASQAYLILKKRQAERKVAGV